MTIPYKRTLVFGLWAMMTASASFASPITSALDRPAVISANADKAYMSGVAQAGNTLIAVGERGIVLLSRDQGHSWQQVPVPVSVTFTAVRFADELHGFIVGHGGVVLATQDGGESWKLKLDGHKAAKIELAQAQLSGDQRSVANAERMVAEGADKPFLDLWVRDNLSVVVVGAYGLAMATSDGGTTWETWGARLQNPRYLHINAIRGEGNLLLLAGEQGLVRVSSDGGKTFTSLATPYSGSFFTAEILSDASFVVAGLKGNAFETKDGGLSWSPLLNQSNANITGSGVIDVNNLMLVNQAGDVMTEHEGVIKVVSREAQAPIHGISILSESKVIVATASGVKTLSFGDRNE